ncbi:MAG: NAD(P)H-quinone oxidoreductase subunit I, chloroplastic [Ignavibacteriaceae bacterium]|nr:NAD(P)H-quinone oxidoreductase subunit I, chloroplastic [Ignavibacteriaceae bacterium]
MFYLYHDYYVCIAMKNAISNYLNEIKSAVLTTLIGMKVTWKNMFHETVTIQYPEEKPILPERSRSRLYVNMDDCIGCDQCARACPVDCIEIETVKSVPGEDLGITSNGKKKVLWVTKFDIDFAKCCHCQLCVFPCPTDCIYMTDVYEYSEYERDSLIYNFVTLTPEEAAQKVDNYNKFMESKAKPQAAAPAPKPQAAESVVQATAPAPKPQAAAPVEKQPEEKPQTTAQTQAAQTPIQEQKQPAVKQPDSEQTQAAQAPIQEQKQPKAKEQPAVKEPNSVPAQPSEQVQSPNQEKPSDATRDSGQAQPPKDTAS